MPSSHLDPPPCHWFSALAAALDPRSAPRLAWLVVGAVLALGRRTVTSWIRAAGLSREFRQCYTTVSAAGRRADLIAAHLAHRVARPLVADAGRLTFALDDTPTERYGRYVQGVGVHHNPTPGPAGSPFVYGHVWVVLGLLAAHPAWGTVALPLLARLADSDETPDAPIRLLLSPATVPRNPTSGSTAVIARRVWARFDTSRTTRSASASARPTGRPCGWPGPGTSPVGTTSRTTTASARSGPPVATSSFGITRRLMLVASAERPYSSAAGHR
jgi:hypothetical protein